VVFLKAKSEALAAFKKFKAWAENLLGLKIKKACRMTREENTCQLNFSSSLMNVGLKGGIPPEIARSRMV
jgi:hypothetical protein